MPEHKPRLSEDEEGRLAEYKITEKPEVRRIERDGTLRKMNWKYTQYKEGQTLPDRISDVYYEVAEGEDVEATNPFQYINPDTLEIRSDTPEEIRKRLSTQIIQYTYDKDGTRVEDGMKKEENRLYHREFPKDCHRKIDLAIDGHAFRHAKVDVLKLEFCPRYDGVDGHLKSNGQMECTDEETLTALQKIVWSRSGKKQDRSQWFEKTGNVVGDAVEIIVRGEKIRITAIEKLHLDTDKDGKPTKAFFQKIEWEYVEKPKKGKE